MTGKTTAELLEGDHAELTRTLDQSDIAAFIHAVGDYNPLHSDSAYAATTKFKAPIAPGIFTAGMISAVIGTKLPGPGAVYLSQDLKFLKPVRAGDTITARVEIVELVRERNRIRLKTVCTNQRGEEVLVGEAWVRPSPRSLAYDERPVTTSVFGAALGPWAWAARVTATWGVIWLCALAALGRRERSRP